MSLDIAAMSVCFVIADRTYHRAKRATAMLLYSSIAAAVALTGYVVDDNLAKAMVMVPAVFAITMGGVYLVYYVRGRRGS